MKRSIQRVLQVFFLILFIALIALGRIQIWVGVFGLGVLLSFFVSRLYCGWVCPINTLTGAVTWLKKKLKIKSFRIPAFVRLPWFRYFCLLFFIGLFAFSMISGKRLPVLPSMLLLGVVFTLFFPEAFWHRYLCPYGTILQLPARFAKKKMTVDPERCNNCTLCARVCPAEAVSRAENSHVIIKKDCLVCLNCQESCRQGAIAYK